MKAAILEKFGGPDELGLKEIPMPDIGPNDVLIQIDYAGIGEWDIFEREGGYTEMLGIESNFPYVLGSESAGSIVALGEKVTTFNIGNKVYAPGFLNPKGGFYAEYVAIDSEYVFQIPENLTLSEAGVITGVGITALRGLEDILKIKQDETILVFGASGGIGHLSVQLAKNMGARVFAVASGDDGVAMVKKLGIDDVIDGYKDDILSAAHLFAPSGFDAALITAGGEFAQKAVQCVRSNGRVAYPNGVQAEPRGRFWNKIGWL